MILDKFRPVFAAEGVGGGENASPAPSAPSSPAPSSAPAPSGGGTSPAALPSGPTGGSQSPVSAETAPPSGEAFDFESIFSGSTEFEGGLPPSKAPAPSPVSPPAEQPPAEQPPAAIPPAAAAPVPPSASPEVAPAPGATAAPATTAPQAEPQPIDPYDPAVMSQHLAQHEAAAIEFVANSQFKLTPEESEALEQDVIGTVPKLLAKVFVKSQQNVLAQLGRMIPVMIQRQNEAMKRNTANEDKFYSRWPDIKRDKHHENVVRYAAVYRQMHPNATLEQMIEDLGPMIMMANKIVPSMQAPGATSGQPARQPGALAPGNGRSPPPSPFVPAGAGPVTQQRAVAQEPWEAMFNQQE